jgi:hypothetical protein
LVCKHIVAIDYSTNERSIILEFQAWDLRLQMQILLDEGADLVRQLSCLSRCFVDNSQGMWSRNIQIDILSVWRIRQIND